MQQAFDALQSIYGPNFRDEDLIQEFQGLMARHPPPSAIHTVESEAAEAELHLADEGLWIYHQTFKTSLKLVMVLPFMLKVGRV